MKKWNEKRRKAQIKSYVTMDGAMRVYEERGDVGILIDAIESLENEKEHLQGKLMVYMQRYGDLD